MTSTQQKVAGYEEFVKDGEESKDGNVIKKEGVNSQNGSSVEQKVFKKDGVWTVNGRPRETIKVISHQHPPNIPGKSMVTLLITLPPNAATPSHTHNGAATIALMVRGSSINQMNCDEPHVYHEGESWYEAPGCHHKLSENACEKEDEDAAFYAVLIVDDEVLEKDGIMGLLVIDAEAEEQERAHKTKHQG